MNSNSLYNTIITRCNNGSKEDINFILELLNTDIDIATTKIIDFYLSTVTNEEGLKEIEFFLFEGTQIQRNYCTLFFSRRDEWQLVHKAFKMGLIDDKQAYSR